MKRAEEGTGEDKASLQEEAGKNRFSSFLCQLHTRLSWGQGCKGEQARALVPNRRAQSSGKRHKYKKGHSGRRATLEERTQDACVGTQRGEQRRLGGVRDASQSGRDKPDPKDEQGAPVA